jgi:hypothetical protein
VNFLAKCAPDANGGIRKGDEKKKVREEDERSLVGGHGNFITIADQIKKFPAPWQRAESRVAEDTTTIIAAAATHIYFTLGARRSLRVPLRLQRPLLFTP